MMGFTDLGAFPQLGSSGGGERLCMASKAVSSVKQPKHGTGGDTAGTNTGMGNASAQRPPTHAQSTEHRGWCPSTFPERSSMRLHHILDWIQRPISSAYTDTALQRQPFSG